MSETTEDEPMSLMNYGSCYKGLSSAFVPVVMRATARRLRTIWRCLDLFHLTKAVLRRFRKCMIGRKSTLCRMTR